MSLLEKSHEYCIAVASHISNLDRIPYLLECLNSLISQRTPINIYLSISFANEDIKEKTLNSLYNNTDFVVPEYLNIRVREKKTPQMRHYFLLYQEIVQTHTWIMFCDDDDTYIPDRTAVIIEAISNAEKSFIYTPELHLAGLYENTSTNSHNIKRHEYWCYCVQVSLMGYFFEHVEPVQGVLEDRCCDVLFGEYLRRKAPNWVYVTISTAMYNYRVEENADSVTGFIQHNQHKYTNQTSPPELGDENWLDYVLNWNDFLHDNIHIFMHDTYLRTLVGCDLETILKTEFKNNYAILDYVDQRHIRKITELYNRVKMVCDIIYDHKLN